MSDGSVLFCRGEEDEADHDEIWDDSELIAAYDRALDSARAELGMIGSMAEGKSNKKWRIGDFCRAVYSEDGIAYEAEILSIGGARCRLRYVGYGNEEDQPLARLQPSSGKKARKKQEKEAENELQALEGVAEYDYEEGDTAEAGNGEEEQATEEDEEGKEEKVPKMEKSVQRGSRNSRKSAPRQGDINTERIPFAAGQSYFGAGQNYHASDQQSLHAGQNPGESYSGWGPCGASFGQYGPMSGPRGPHFEPWGPRPGPLGPPHNPWAAASPFAGPWGPHQGFPGPLDPAASFSSHPPMPPPPPPPPPISGDADPVQLANMLMSWYISGYHTGYYQAGREAARTSRTDRK